MRYVIRRVLYKLRWNKWISILMVIEIAMGISVFTYSSNLHYSLAKEEAKINAGERDLALRISEKDMSTEEENTALTLQDYKKILKLSKDEAYIYISIPEFCIVDDKEYNYTLLLVDFDKNNLEKSFAYWGSNIQEIMSQDLLNDFKLGNKKMPDKINEEVWKTEAEEISLKDCILIPISYMEELQEEISSGQIHIEWNSEKLRNPENVIEKVEEYLNDVHGEFFDYQIYSPEIELRNNSENTKTSIQAINKASELFLVMVFVGMWIIFQLLFEHRKKTYGISLACGAIHRQLFAEIFTEIVLLNVFGTIIGCGIGFLATYQLNLQIMIGYIEVVGDFRTLLWSVMLCSITAFAISVTVYQKLKHKNIAQLLKES